MAEFIIPTDGSGEADVTPEIGLYGILEGMTVEYDPAMTGSPVVTIKEVSGLKRTILSLTGTTPYSGSPSKPISDAEGAEITGAASPYALEGRINITIESGVADLAEAITVTMEIVRGT